MSTMHTSATPAQSRPVPELLDDLASAIGEVAPEKPKSAEIPEALKRYLHEQQRIALELEETLNYLGETNEDVPAIAIALAARVAGDLYRALDCVAFKRVLAGAEDAS